MSVCSEVFGDGGPWITGPDAAEPIPLDDALLARPEVTTCR